MPQSDYRVAMLPPPGNIVAPRGFPADPRPAGAPQLFLDAMDVRLKVFCDEQKCALEPELDEDDPRSVHWVVYYTGGPGPEQPVSVIRIVPPPHGPHPNGFHDPHEEPYVKLGRVATMPEFRRRGLTRMLSEAAFRWLVANREQVGGGWKDLVLTHAQVDVEKMYGRMGFVTDDKLGRWDEEGIEHLGMWKRLDAVP
ncbi:GNAT family acetyltransferase [Exophiala viscosa]|uniref:GNAT family acetyltransferase n=1 Tax=Exophiala viscosa TaxID=2486360 RepID=A0AAN6DMW0_9EURO|nr:GNAT family acetyltransferase [Exophiala viscosa]KAI1620330.1 GNAT family acetyltransferase [Exophiala viscosa]